MILKHDVACKELVIPNKQAIAEVCQTLGIRSITVKYRGGGDTGVIESVLFNPSFEDGAENAIHLYLKRPEYDDRLNDLAFVLRVFTLKEAVEELTVDVLNTYEPGWQLDTGSKGKLYLDVQTGLYELKHINFFQEHRLISA